MSNSIQASVIITAHSKPNRLRLTLAGIFGQSSCCNFEIIIVADGATKTVWQVIEESKQGRKLRVISSPSLGRAGARNLGAMHAKGAVLIFVDDDILVEGDFVQQHILEQQQHPGLVKGQLREAVGLLKVEDPAIGGVGCKPISEQELLAGKWRSTGVRLVQNALEHAAESQDGFNAPWLASAGANLSISKQHWQQAGKFDESYGTRWGLEDLDFGFRVYQVGLQITLSNKARGVHMSHPQANRWEQQCLNLWRFQQKVSSPEAKALPFLLSETGSLAKFKARVHQIRQEAIPLS
ncbi:Glycosyl transferase [Vibrio crassostreae]|nr:Glycosyl transferase [Vibrio crassostreae]CAK2773686.1 Glycosyl transferase [Vibrio crassostreae]CAK3218572.1 Glycosyl transferase [Vibrio crassostreae]CAK3841213.1 Glycosyl transferase [Vibrio crassostreae]